MTEEVRFSAGFGEVGIAIVRVFDAPRERVWEEWTRPAAFADWFGGPEAEVPVESVTMDLRPGGVLRATMYAGPQRREIHWHGEYLVVDPPERLAFTITDRPAPPWYDLVTVTLADLGDGRTEMRFEQRGQRPPEAYEATKAGWGVFFDRMGARLAEA